MLLKELIPFRFFFYFLFLYILVLLFTLVSNIPKKNVKGSKNGDHNAGNDT